jgi:hypothetical protein
MKRTFAGLIAFLTWVGLAMQFAWAIDNPAVQDISVAERIIRYFSFFTVVGNGIIAVIAMSTAAAPNSSFSRRVQNGSVLTAAAVYITIVAVVYSLFLRSVVNAQGWHLISDHIVHDVVPAVFVLYWVVFSPKNDVKWLDPVKWLIVPAFTSPIRLFTEPSITGIHTGSPTLQSSGTRPRLGMPCSFWSAF